MSKKATIICLNCGKEHEVDYRKRNTTKFCSLSCSMAHRHKMNPKEKVEKVYNHVCEYCGKEFTTDVWKKQKYCSKECKDAGSVRNREKTTIEKYGVSNINKLKEFREKIENTCKERYGGISPLSNEEVKKKTVETVLKKYGVSNVMKNEEIKKKADETILEKYGVQNISQSDEIKKKKEETSIRHFGVPYHTQNKDQINKVKKIMFDSYGVENICQRNMKNIENYNEEYIRANFIKDGYFDLLACKEYFGISQDITLNRMKPRFNILEPNLRQRSRLQKEIVDFIKTFYKGEIRVNDFSFSKKLEIDVYIPEKNLAIEFDGLLYHSYGKSKYPRFDNAGSEDMYYHLRKTEMCEDQGVKLFHIWENEWVDEAKQEIWKSKLKVELGFADTKINARDCEIKEVLFSDSCDFLSLNHLQGNSQSKIRYGLYYQDKLVYLVSFGKSRFNKNYDWELTRACSSLNTVVMGGFSKLLNYFKEHHKGTIISYGNRRWTSKINNVYNSSKLINISAPNYFYFHISDTDVLFSRQTFQKHKLKDKLEIFDENLSEVENMYNNGFRRIFDCGNLVYEIKV